MVRRKLLTVAAMVLILVGSTTRGTAQVTYRDDPDRPSESQASEARLITPVADPSISLIIKPGTSSPNGVASRQAFALKPPTDSSDTKSDRVAAKIKKSGDIPKPFIPDDDNDETEAIHSKAHEAAIAFAKTVATEGTAEFFDVYKSSYDLATDAMKNGSRSECCGQTNNRTVTRGVPAAASRSSELKQDAVWLRNQQKLFDLFSVPENQPGLRSATAAPRVVGPDVRNTTPTEYLDCVAIAGANGSVFCTGTIVAPTIVLTAAHCIASEPRFVYVGRSINEPMKGYRVSQRIIHRRFNAAACKDNNQCRYDIAILKLESPVVGVRPRQLATAAELRAAPFVEVVGFGYNSTSGTGLGQKRMVDVPIASCGGECNPGEELVARSARGNDTCNGDSGGPAYIKVGNQWKIAGITSRGFRGTDCGAGGIYTRVDAYRAWIGSDVP